MTLNQLYVDRNRLLTEIARRKKNIPGFAQEAALSASSVYRVFDGQTTTPKTLGKLAAALDIDDPTELLLKPQEAHNG